MEKGNDYASPDAEVIVASVPTLGRTGSGDERLSRFDPSQFKCIIVDEAHHSVADSYLRIMRHFGLPSSQEQKKNDILLWGCSATLSRNDELALGDLFESVVFHLGLGEMIERGWLCPVEMYQVSTDINLSQVAWRAGDFDPKSLQLAIDTPLRNQLIVSCWQQHAVKATIVFALNIEHCRSLQAAFLGAGIPAQVITSETAPLDRQTMLAQYQAGHLPVLINCAVLTEGTDLPRTDCIVMTRPTCNPNLYMQMVGRGLRLHPDKQKCLVLDVVDRLRGPGRTLVSMPSLLAGRALSSPKEKEAKAERTQSDPVKELNPDQIDVQVERIEATDLQLDRRLAWIKIEEDHWILTGKQQLYRLTPQWHICALHAGSKRKRGEFVNAYQAPSLAQVCQQLYDSLDEEQLESLGSKSYWRSICPPSAAQLKLLASIGAQTGMSGLEFRLLYRLTVGRAAQIISKFFYLTKHLKRTPTWAQLIE